MYSFHHINPEDVRFVCPFHGDHYNVQALFTFLDAQLDNFGQMEAKLEIVAQDLIEACHSHHGLRQSVRSIDARLIRLCSAIMSRHHYVIEQLKSARQLLVEDKFHHFNQWIYDVHRNYNDKFEAIDNMLEQFTLSFYVAYPWSLSPMNVVGEKIKALKEFGNLHLDYLDHGAKVVDKIAQNIVNFIDHEPRGSLASLRDGLNYLYCRCNEDEDLTTDTYEYLGGDSADYFVID